MAIGITIGFIYMESDSEIDKQELRNTLRNVG